MLLQFKNTFLFVVVYLFFNLPWQLWATVALDLNPLFKKDVFDMNDLFIANIPSDKICDILVETYSSNPLEYYPHFVISDI